MYYNILNDRFIRFIRFDRFIYQTISIYHGFQKWHTFSIFCITKSKPLSLFRFGSVLIGLISPDWTPLGPSIRNKLYNNKKKYYICINKIIIYKKKLYIIYTNKFTMRNAQVLSSFNLIHCLYHNTTLYVIGVCI